MIAARIKPLDLAARSATTLFSEFATLAIAIAGPEFLRCAIYFMDSLLAAENNQAGFFPWWSTKAVDLSLVSVMFVIIIRYLVLGKTPKLMPMLLPWKSISLVALIMLPLWFALDALTDQAMLLRFYHPFTARWTEEEIVRAVFYFSIFSFFLHVFAVSMLYPLLGIAASTGEFMLHKYFTWLKRQFIPFFVLAALLIASIEAIRILYGKLLAGISTQFPPSPLSFDWKTAILEQLSYVPIDFVYVAVPSIAISLIFTELRTTDPIL